MKPLASRLPLVAENYLGVSYDRMDCQKFVETCLCQVGITLDLPGSNAWYRKMTWVGTPEACVKRFGSVPAGAFLFILEQDSKEPAKYRRDGIGNASHIGIKTGRGDGAIHSSMSRGCVATSQFRDKTINGGWNRVGLWDALSYGEAADALLAGNTDDQKRRDTMNDFQKMVVFAENGEPVNLRAKPDRGSARVSKVPAGTQVEAGPEENGWRPVRFGNVSGWMMAVYLKEPEPIVEMVSVPKNDLLRVYDQLGDWLHLRGERCSPE